MASSGFWLVPRFWGVSCFICGKDTLPVARCEFATRLWICGFRKKSICVDQTRNDAGGTATAPEVSGCTGPGHSAIHTHTDTHTNSSKNTLWRKTNFVLRYPCLGDVLAQKCSNRPLRFHCSTAANWQARKSRRLPRSCLLRPTASRTPARIKSS